MNNDKKWDRKEVVTVDPGSLLFCYQSWLYS